MKRFALTSPLIISCQLLILCIATQAGFAQNPIGDAQGGLDDAKSRIATNRVQRQVDVGRLQQRLEGLEARVEYLERKQLADYSLPAISVEEASAILQLTVQREKELRTELKKNEGETKSSQLAKAVLEVARARRRLQTAQHHQTSSELGAELDVLHFQRAVNIEAASVQQLERLVARGVIKSDGLTARQLDLEIAEKRLQLAQNRLSTIRDMGPTQSHRNDESSGSKSAGE